MTEMLQFIGGTVVILLLCVWVAFALVGLGHLVWLAWRWIDDYLDEVQRMYHDAE